MTSATGLDEVAVQPKNAVSLTETDSGRRDWKFCLLLLSVLAVLYGGLQNGQWVPSGSDDAYYLAIARNLVNGQGYTWNGEPVRLAPPGWPLLLAAALRVDSSFLFLNMLPPALCVAAGCMWFWVLRQYTTAGRAVLAVLAVALLYDWHRFAFQHYSESLFYFLFSAVLLVAVQIQKGLPVWWRAPLLLALCVSMVFVRFAGLLIFPVLAGILLTGELRPRLNRLWLTTLASGVIIAISLLGVRNWMNNYAREQVRQAHHAELAQIAAQPGQSQRVETIIEEKVSDQAPEPKFGKRITPMEYGRRLLMAGEWPTRLFWPPAVMGESRDAKGTAISWISNVLGWLLMGLFIFQAVRCGGKRQWIYLGVALYCFALAIGHWRQIGRYFAPIAPLLLLGIWQAMERLGEGGKIQRRAFAATALALLAASVLINGAIWCMNAYVIHSRQFSDRWLAGEYGEMLRIGQYLNQRGLKDNEAALAVRYDDPIRIADDGWARRSLHLLTNRTLRTAPRTERQTLLRLVRWARTENVRYIVTRADRQPPRRLWHFRLDEDKSLPYYILYEVKKNSFAPVSMPETSRGLARVPGVIDSPVCTAGCVWQE